MGRPEFENQQHGQNRVRGCSFEHNLTKPQRAPPINPDDITHHSAFITHYQSLVSPQS
jgi:hypothetical protein